MHIKYFIVINFIIAVMFQFQTIFPMQAPLNIFSIDQSDPYFPFAGSQTNFKITYDVEDKYLSDNPLKEDEAIVDIFSFRADSASPQLLSDGVTSLNEPILTQLKERHDFCILNKGNYYWIPMFKRQAGIIYEEYDQTNIYEKWLSIL